MRFDDRLKTALMQPWEDSSRAKTQWAQLIDLLSQYPKPNETQIIASGLLRLRELMDIVPERHRVSGVQLVMGRLESAPLLQLLTGDTPLVALSAIKAAKFGDEQWAEIIPSLPTRARGFLRNRDDLGVKAQNSLSIWASADFILPSYNNNPIDVSNFDDELITDNQVNENLSEKDTSFIMNNNIDELDDALILNESDAISEISVIENNRQRIDEIVAKIENLRSSREQYDAPQLPLLGGTENNKHRLNEIYFATDEQGTINWVDGAPRGALVGTSLSEPSYDNVAGPDAAGAAAFKQRLILENARIKLCGTQMIDGDWRMNAAPFFNDHDGRFKGYKGLLRRPNIFENAGNEIPISSTFDKESSDNLQQLIHELRTPLGAVIGFAEIIEQQLFGPASTEYRLLAKTILEEGNRLLSGFDDLNIAAQIDSGIFQASLGVTSCPWLMNKVCQKLRPLLDSQKVELNIMEVDNIKSLMVDNDDAERLFIRLLSALIIAADKNEILIGRWQKIGNIRPVNQFSINLPQSLLAMNEKQLLEGGPESSEENIKAPLLGLGFSLRLVRNLANNIGASLLFQKDMLVLNLPVSRDKLIINDEEDID